MAASPKSNGKPQAKSASTGVQMPIQDEYLARFAKLRGETLEQQKPHAEDELARARTDSLHSLAVGECGTLLSKRDPNFGKSMKQNLFLDAEDMKKKARSNFNAVQFSESDYYSASGTNTTGKAADIARTPLFQTLAIVIICANAVWIGVETDLNEHAHLNDADIGWQVGEHLFCILFTLELLIRFLAFHIKLNIIHCQWFQFDFVLVVLMVVETYGGSTGGLGDMTLVRMLRLLRMTRLVRLMRAVPELLTILSGVAAATRSVITTLCLIGLFTYIFAVIFRVQLGEDEEFKSFFSSVPQAMWTLFVTGALLDGIADVLLSVRRTSGAMFLAFLLYLAVSAFVLMNMLIGILTHVITAVASHEKEKHAVNFLKERLGPLLQKETDRQMKENPSAQARFGGAPLNPNSWLAAEEVISHDIFHKLLEEQTVISLLGELGIRVELLRSISDSIFDDGETDIPKKISNVEFMEVLLHLRGGDSATVGHVMEIRKFVKERLQEMGLKQDALASKVSSITNGLNQLLEMEGMSPVVAPTYALSEHSAEHDSCIVSPARSDMAEAKAKAKSKAKASSGLTAENERE